MTDIVAGDGIRRDIRMFLLILAGLIISSGVPAILFELVTQFRGSYPMGLLIFGGFAVFFGLPSYLSLRNDGKDCLLSAVVAGFTIGGAPMLILSLLLIGGRADVFLEGLAFTLGMAALGATGGALFWFFVAYPGPPYPDGRPLAPSWARTLSTCIAAGALIGACFLPS